MNSAWHFQVIIEIGQDGVSLLLVVSKVVFTRKSWLFSRLIRPYIYGIHSACKSKDGIKIELHQHNGRLRHCVNALCVNLGQ